MGRRLKLERRDLFLPKLSVDLPVDLANVRLFLFKIEKKKVVESRLIILSKNLHLMFVVLSWKMNCFTKEAGKRRIQE